MTKKPSPGSDAAIAKGCKCPVLDNAHGKGCGWPTESGGPAFWINADCPLHAGAKNVDAAPPEEPQVSEALFRLYKAVQERNVPVEVNSWDLAVVLNYLAELPPPPDTTGVAWREAAKEILDGEEAQLYHRAHPDRDKESEEEAWDGMHRHYIDAINSLREFLHAHPEDAPEGPWEVKDINDIDRCWGPTVWDSRVSPSAGGCIRGSSMVHFDTMAKATAVRDAWNRLVGGTND